MKRFKKMTWLGNERGIAVLLVAGIMVAFLLLFMVVGLEFARMYYVRGELQNAADASALAGVKLIEGSSTVPGTAMIDDNVAAYQQLAARQAAWKFACRNTAAGSRVFLAGEGSDCNTPPADLNQALNDPNGDIVVGYWSKTPQPCPSTGATDRFCPASGSTGKPVNALKTRPQRASGLEPARGSVDFLFPGVGNLVGWTKMDVRRVAIADSGPAAGTYITTCWNGASGVCQDQATGASCVYPNTCTFAPRFLIKDGTSAISFVDDMAWTSLKNNTSNTDVGALLCGAPPTEEVCGNNITTTAGTESSFATLESRMYNPSYATDDKTCGSIGGPYIPDSCSGSAPTVNGWNVTIPVVSVCPATDQPGGLPVWGYAKIHVIAVCGSSAGSGNSCAKDYQAPTTPTDVCKYYGAMYKATYGHAGNNFVVIDGVQCIDCAHEDYMPGDRLSLVK
jgi:hypothetical protein